jgi:phosphonate transport system permease protein
MRNRISHRATTAPDNPIGAAVVANDAIAAFERTRRELNRTKHLKAMTFGSLFLAAVAGSLWVSEVSLAKFVEGFPGLVAYIRGTLPVIRADHFVADVAEWYWGIGRWLSLLLDTLVMAFMGTLFGATSAFLVCFAAARNLTPRGWVYVICRRLLEIARTVPELVFALIFVYAFGLGPLPGVLAIAVHSMGALGKLFSEVNENIDPGPVEGVWAAGGNWFQVIRYAVVPKVLSNFTSYALLRFEIADGSPSSSSLPLAYGGSISRRSACGRGLANWDGCCS